MSLQNDEVCVCGMICTEYWEIEIIYKNSVHMMYRCDDCYRIESSQYDVKKYKETRVENREDGTIHRTVVYDPNSGRLTKPCRVAQQ